MTSSDFASLGIPFPLFEAPASEAYEYAGRQSCLVCDAVTDHAFRLGIGSDLIVACPSCTTKVALDAYDKKARTCPSCSSLVPFPNPQLETAYVCYSCLRSGHAALTKDTEFGMITWECTNSGVTHGLPGLVTSMFETVETDDEWVGVRMPPSEMFELLRTPSYPTIQGENWQFHCKKPMVYVGSWTRDEFEARAPDGDGKKYFDSIVQDSVPGLWEDQLHDVTGIYVFRCSECGAFTAHWDIA